MVSNGEHNMSSLEHEYERDGMKARVNGNVRIR